MNDLVRDKELMRILSRVEKLDLDELSVSQIMAFKSMIMKAETRSKWLHNSCKAGNLMRKLDRAVARKVREYNYWGMSA